ncbi:MAG: GntR family transcriptional regulator [Clostridiales bacterium]|nr:GntR family transcriptional regulator [Clostridiales bacterium]
MDVILIDKKSPVPAYFQLRNIILKKIENGEYVNGSTLPSERELAELSGLSRMTVRQALGSLSSEGYLSREKGRGTYVSGVMLEQRNIMSFTEMAANRGVAPVTKVLGLEKKPSTPDISFKLGITNSDNIYDVRRLRLAGEVPVGIEEAHIPARYCPGLEKLDLTGSIYRIFREEYGHEIEAADSMVEAIKASQEEKELLDIKGYIPLLCISTLYYGNGGIRLFYEKAVYRSDEFKYSVRINTNHTPFERSENNGGK